MNSNPELSIVLPAYLEEENLRVLLPRLQEVLKKMNLRFEILVVDTAKPMDNTQAVCESFGVRSISRRGGDTFGDAVRTGIDESQGKYTLFMDSDGSHTPEYIPKLWEHALDSDVVIASRYIEGGHSENSVGLLLMSRVLNWTYSFVLGLKCKDVSNSFKIYRTAQLKALRLECDNFDLIEEILYKLKRAHKDLRIYEVPFTFKKRMFGETKRNLVIFILTYFYTIIKLRLGR